MANTVNMLKLAIAGFMQRDPGVFVRGEQPNTVDLLLQACNNARLYAERRIDFELSKCDVTIADVSLTNGGSLEDAVLKDSNPAEAVRVKKIITPYLPLADAGDVYPVDLISRKSWDENVKRRFSLASPKDRIDLATFTTAPFVLVQDGNLIFVTPADTSQFDSTFTVSANVVRWLDAYVQGDVNMTAQSDQNDFLLDNCFDWMLFYGITQLNFYLKEDQRVQLSSSMLKDTWDSMVTWNNELIKASSDDVNLD